MRPTFCNWFAPVAALCLLVIACSQGNGQTAATGSSASADAGFAVFLASYEAARAALAGDRIADAVFAAKGLEAACKASKSSMEPAQHGDLDALAKASARLSQQSSDDARAVRRAFGEVSRHLITILRAAPKLRAGLYLFECPMAEGFKQWVAQNEQIENPYMGSQMLHCGSKRQF